jgi:hypothetical protein
MALPTPKKSWKILRDSLKGCFVTWVSVLVIIMEVNLNAMIGDVVITMAVAGLTRRNPNVMTMATVVTTTVAGKSLFVMSTNAAMMMIVGLYLNAMITEFVVMIGDAGIAMATGGPLKNLNPGKMKWFLVRQSNPKFLVDTTLTHRKVTSSSSV